MSKLPPGVRAVPATWKGADTSLPGRAMVVAPTPDQVAAFGTQQERATCGQCRYFQPQHLGQNFSAKEAFRLHVVREAGWKENFLCEDPAKMGRCKEDAETACGPNSASCSHFKPK